MRNKTISEFDKEIDDLWHKERELSEKVSDYNFDLAGLSEDQEAFGYFQGELSTSLMDLADRYPTTYYDLMDVEERLSYQTRNLFEIYDDELERLKKKRRQVEEAIDTIFYQRLNLNASRDESLANQGKGEG